MATKNNSVVEGVTPCAYCGRKSETINKAGEAVCMTHYITSDKQGISEKKADEAIKSMDQQLDTLTPLHTRI